MMTIKDYVTECLLFEYSEDNYELSKEIKEAALMEQYIENQCFIMENADTMDLSFLESKNNDPNNASGDKDESGKNVKSVEDSLNKKKSNILKRLGAFISSGWKKFVASLTKFFTSIKNKIHNIVSRAKGNEKGVDISKEIAASLTSNNFATIYALVKLVGAVNNDKELVFVRTNKVSSTSGVNLKKSIKEALKQEAAKDSNINVEDAYLIISNFIAPSASVKMVNKVPYADFEDLISIFNKLCKGIAVENPNDKNINRVVNKAKSSLKSAFSYADKYGVTIPNNEDEILKIIMDLDDIKEDTKGSSIFGNDNDDYPSRSSFDVNKISAETLETVRSLYSQISSAAASSINLANKYYKYYAKFITSYLGIKAEKPNKEDKKNKEDNKDDDEFED